MKMTMAGGLAVAASAAFAAPSQAVHQTVTGLTTTNTIVTFPVGTPNNTTAPVAITGLGLADLVGIDYRPRSGELFGVGDNGAIFIINPTSGAATQVGVTPVVNPFTNATAFGVDFNPVPDRIRVVNNAPSGADNNNFRFRPDTGALAATDADLSEGSIVAVAYDRNFDGTPTTTLSGIDSGDNSLVRQGGENGVPSPNGGVITQIGPLGAAAGDITDIAGFDIETQTDTYYAATQTMGETVSRFFRLEEETGTASAPVAANDTRIGGATGPLVESVSLAPIPVLRFDNASTSVAEGDMATVTLTRTGPLNQTATVNYTAESVAGDTATAGGNDYAQGTDYNAVTGTVTFPAGVATGSFQVPTTEDTIDEVTETFTVRMSAPSTNLNLGASPLVSKVNIVDDDDAAPGGGKATAPIGLINVPTQKIDKSIRAIYSCDQACAAKLTLKLGKRKLDTVSSSLADSGKAKVTFKLSKREVRKVLRAARGTKVAKLKATGVFSDADGSTKSTAKFALDR